MAPFLCCLSLQSLSLDVSEMSLEDGSDESSFRFLWRFFFLSRFIFWKFCWSCQWNITIKSSQWNIFIWSIHLNIFILSSQSLFSQIMSSQLNIFTLKNIPSFNSEFLNIFSICLFRTHSVCCNFRNTMPRRDKFVVIRQPFHSGNGDEDIIQFVCCVDGRESQINKLWSFAKDGNTREVHPFARADVGDFYGDFFQTHYMTEEACRVVIFGQRFINASVKWIGTRVPSNDTIRVPWTGNILVPEFLWGDRGNYKICALKTQSEVCFWGRSVPCHGAVPFRAAYLLRSPVLHC